MYKILSKNSKKFFIEKIKILLFQIIFSLLSNYFCKLYIKNSSKKINYLIGENIKEKIKNIDFLCLFLLLIFFLDLICNIIHIYLWEKSKYIKNIKKNEYFLYNIIIFSINSLIHILIPCTITLSLTNYFSIFLLFLFITINHFLKKNKTIKLEKFFSWETYYIKKMTFFYSFIIIFLPILMKKIDKFHNKKISDLPEGLSKILKKNIYSNEILKNFFDLLIEKNSSFESFYWFVLLWFIWKIINFRINDYNNFWENINNIEKKILIFKYYYFYQKEKNIIDCNYLKNNPIFLIKKYYEEENIENILKITKEIINFIKICEKNFTEKEKKYFLYYLFFKATEKDFFLLKKMFKKD